jgi:hypothetical protein
MAWPDERFIDHRYADGRFRMSPSRGVTVSNQNFLSSSETRVNAAIQEDVDGTYLPESTSRQESIGGTCFTMNK